MSTVASRIFRSTPHRDAATTWNAIVDFLTQGRAGSARAELLGVSGIAASIIADQAPKDAPIVITCDGPRTRIYCLYDEDAVDGSDASEDALGFDPLNGDWHVSLPCAVEDLAWVQRSLAQKSTRITARGPDEAAAGRSEKPASALLTIDPKGFLAS